MKENRPSAFDKLISGGGAYETTAHSGPWMDNDWMFMAEGSFVPPNWHWMGVLDMIVIKSFIPSFFFADIHSSWH